MVLDSSPAIPDVKDTPESQNLVGESHWHRGEVLVAGKGPTGSVKDYIDVAQFQGHRSLVLDPHRLFIPVGAVLYHGQAEAVVT